MLTVSLCLLFSVYVHIHILAINSNLRCFDQLRTEVNKVLEVARSGKLIGSSLEAKVYLHTSDASLAARLSEACESKTDADTLPRIFITSQVISFMVGHFN